MNRTLCYVCQQNRPLDGELICATCTRRRNGEKICGHCGKGALVVGMRTTNITYYDCDNPECGQRQMVQTGGE